MPGVPPAPSAKPSKSEQELAQPSASERIRQRLIVEVFFLFMHDDRYLITQTRMSRVDEFHELK